MSEITEDVNYFGSSLIEFDFSFIFSVVFLSAWMSNKKNPIVAIIVNMTHNKVIWWFSIFVYSFHDKKGYIVQYIVLSQIESI